MFLEFNRKPRMFSISKSRFDGLVNFLIHSLDPAPFAPLAFMDDDALAARQARRMTVDKKPGFPCRVTLADAEIGEEILLVHYQHQPADSPFRSSHAVYVRPTAQRRVLNPNEVPAMLRSRLLSVRAFDDHGMMLAADVCEGTALESVIAQMFASDAVAYLHLHFAKPGCYAARIDRA